MVDLLSQDELDTLLAEFDTDGGGDEGLDFGGGDETGDESSLESDLADLLAGGVESQESEVSAPVQTSSTGNTGNKGDKGEKVPIPDSIKFILDVNVRASVEIGRTKMMLHDLVQLGQGSIIELTKSKTEKLDFLINNNHVAKGSAIVIKENVGIRLTEILSLEERIKQL